MILPNRLGVLLADDNPVFLEMVVELLSDHFDITGKFLDGAPLLAGYERLAPDLVVLDISMPGMSGLEVATQLSHRVSPPKIIFLSVYDTPEFVRAAFDAGASGYVFKSQLEPDLEKAIESVMAGEHFVSTHERVKFIPVV